MLVPKGVRGTFSQEDSATIVTKEVGGVFPPKGSATTRAEEVAPEHLGGGTREVVAGAKTNSTSSSLTGIVAETLDVVALSWDGGACTTTDGPPIECPGHGRLAMALLVGSPRGKSRKHSTRIFMLVSRTSDLAKT